MAIAVSDQKVVHREVDLKQKPEEMTSISPKATVPVLQLSNGEILEESLDIMKWALNINDPEHWLLNADNQLAVELISINDNQFKYHLDRYKYADRYPQHSLEYYREKASDFPMKLDALLGNNAFLLSEIPSMLDVAIFPFIRQFAFVDKNWFDTRDWPYLQKWLKCWLNSRLFESVMKKHRPWRAGDDSVFFPFTL
jgi:glutathione S-transferase